MESPRQELEELVEKENSCGRGTREVGGGRGGKRGGGGERRPREDDVAAKEERDKETDADNEKTSEERRLE